MCVFPKVVGCVAQKTSNERIVKENIVAHYTALNATNIEFLNIKAWKYFPRYIYIIKTENINL
jgi:hypothetical protein